MQVWPNTAGALERRSSQLRVAAWSGWQGKMLPTCPMRLLQSAARRSLKLGQGSGRASRTFFVGSLPDAQLISVPTTFSSAGGSVSAIRYVFVCTKGIIMKRKYLQHQWQQHCIYC